MTATKPRKQPQDRKPKAKPYTFDVVERVKVNGRLTNKTKTYTLPFASKGAKTLPGKFTRDAIMSPDDESVQLRLGIALLEETGVDQETLDVLYAKPGEEMITILAEWMQHGDGQGGTVPQS